MGKDTEVQKSEKSFEVKSLKRRRSKVGKTIILEELPQLTQFQHVTELVKVICVDEPNEVPSGKMKQDVQVGDSTGTVQVTFWEMEIGKVNVGKKLSTVWDGGARVPIKVGSSFQQQRTQKLKRLMMLAQ